MKKYTLKTMTGDNFAPYGTMLSYPEEIKPDVSIPDLDYWKIPLSLADLGKSGELTFMRVKRRKIQLKTLDMLTNSAELYLSLDGRSSIFFAAPDLEKTNIPDLNELQVFLFSGPGGFIVNPGVWHWTPFPLSYDADFALGLQSNVLQKKGSQIEVSKDEIVYFNLDKPIDIPY